jgi:molybdopterin converting factor subunit 1
MPATVLFFASAREAAGTDRTEVELTNGSIGSDDLLRLLTERHPALQSVLKACVMAVNQEYLEMDAVHQIKDGDEVAIIPPLSGG